eukprot:1346277-Prymnesium_polylepis.2
MRRCRGRGQATLEKWCVRGCARASFSPDCSSNPSAHASYTAASSKRVSASWPSELKTLIAICRDRRLATSADRNGSAVCVHSARESSRSPTSTAHIIKLRAGDHTNVRPLHTTRGLILRVSARTEALTQSSWARAARRPNWRGPRTSPRPRCARRA